LEEVKYDFETSTAECVLLPFAVVIADRSWRFDKERRELLEDWLIEKLKSTPIDDINALIWSEFTLLELAFDYRCDKVAEYLLSRSDVDPNTRGYQGETVLMKLAGFGNWYGVFLLMSHPKIQPAMEDAMGLTVFDHGLNARENCLGLLLGKIFFTKKSLIKKKLPLAQKTLKKIFKKK